MRRPKQDFSSLGEHTKTEELDTYYFPKEGFNYQDLVVATRNFSDTAIVGKGACGTVYKATMSDGEILAVKKLKSRGEGASTDNSFCAEISTLGKIRHKNIVKLYGFCYHNDSNLILYEYMANGKYAYTMKVTEKCDIYSFGVVLLELITDLSAKRTIEEIIFFLDVSFGVNLSTRFCKD
ncbi:hypothetical protein ACJIZ3_019647 [Penstemon smallii]|uniref:non-specific serine/threonine protein kinase n=1 Tax=Penstemon smallii TaxID=265156 RepID=A0ABD3T2Q7_9LAMI